MAKRKKEVEPKKEVVKKVVETTYHKCIECGNEFTGKRRPCTKCHGLMLRTRVERS